MKIRINQLSKNTPFVTYLDSKKQPVKRSFVSTKKIVTIEETLSKLQALLKEMKGKTDTIKKHSLNRIQYNHLDITNQLKREPKQKAIRKPTTASKS